MGIWKMRAFYFLLVSSADYQEYHSLLTFGTDPSKSGLVRLGGPILDHGKFLGVEVESILRGIEPKQTHA
jgi:hypothetical protein